jgi:hypothetical protein
MAVDFPGVFGLEGDFGASWCTKITLEPQSTRIFSGHPPHDALVHQAPTAVGQETPMMTDL